MVVFGAFAGILLCYVIGFGADIPCRSQGLEDRDIGIELENTYPSDRP